MDGNADGSEADGRGPLPEEEVSADSAEGEALPGGGVGGAVRAGDTVRRPSGPWSPAVHRLLDHVRRRGLDGVPRPLGFEVRDGRRVEVLSYLPGDCVEAYDPWPAWAWSDSLLCQVAAWTRRFHDAVSDFRPADAPRWRSGVRELGEDEIVCHHDIAPYNVIVDTATGGAGEPPRLVGVIDWDVAGPGTPVQDLAFAAWNFLPLNGEQPPPAGEVARRLRLLAGSYGAGGTGAEARRDPVGPAEILAAIGPRLRRSVDVIRSGARAGDAGMRNLVASGRVAAVERHLERFHAALPDIRSALRDESARREFSDSA